MWDRLIHKWLHVPYALNVHTDHRTKRPRATILLIHGIGNSGAAWDDVVANLPHDLRIVSIDLLGFGASPRPSWALYSVATQARSVMATFLKLRLHGQVIIVGHSLGALVAVEIARRYPLLVRSLVLFCPPFYRQEATASPLPSSDEMLKDIYRVAKHHPGETVKIAGLAAKLGLLNKAFNLTEQSAPIYMNALEASIINQTSLRDALALKVPTHILYGRLDPVVLPRNLRYLAKHNPHVTLTPVLASHEVTGPFIKPATQAIRQAAEK